ncbi:DUF4082 domain-containing protein [Microlunatus sp. Gsoil 973]|nr:DUF4082 domain-containing protein [Microlunatus sp. Gsoil 973]
MRRSRSPDSPNTSDGAPAPPGQRCTTIAADCWPPQPPAAWSSVPPDHGPAARPQCPPRSRLSPATPSAEILPFPSAITIPRALIADDGSDGDLSTDCSRRCADASWGIRRLRGEIVVYVKSRARALGQGRRTGSGHRPIALVIAITLILGMLGSWPLAQTARAATCPCTIFGTRTPGTLADPDTSAVELGVKFRADQDGFVTGIRFYKGSGNTGTHTGSLWNTAGNRLATVTFTGESGSGWQQAEFATPVPVTANTTYVASYYAPAGHYSSDNNFFSSAGTVSSPLTALQDGTDGGNGVYRYGVGGGFPNSTYQGSNYWVDVVFNSSGVDTTKPTVTDRQPAAGTTGVPVGASVTATFSEAIQQSSIAFTLAGPSAVPATVSYDPDNRRATLTPNAALATSTTYTASLSGARDPAGNVMDPVTWTFTTGATASGCPCTIWPNSATPATASTADDSAVEVGVKFRTSQNGFITGIRFYKGAGNSGTHVGSLWSRTGTKLASATFSGETSSGWQQTLFGAPVAVTANTTYVASYYAPVGRYANNGSYFANAATTRGPLTALRNGTDGSNGVYKYGASGFPHQRLPVDQLLGGCRLRHQRRGHHGADRGLDSAVRRRDRRSRLDNGVGDLLRKRELRRHDADRPQRQHRAGDGPL